jgi:hypothetical protein
LTEFSFCGDIAVACGTLSSHNSLSHRYLFGIFQLELCLLGRTSSAVMCDRRTEASMRVRVLVLAGVLWCAATPARADLIDLGDGLIYDTVQDLTWMQDVMYTRTAGLDADGLFERHNVAAVVDSFSYAGSSDWRLPLQRTAGIWFASDSEVSTLMAGLGWHWHSDDPSLPGAGDYVAGGAGPFLNLGQPVWLSGAVGGGAFNWWSVFYNVDYADAEATIWFVHDGKLDPGYSAGVPEPSTTLLVGIGLASYGLRKLRRRRLRREFEV